MSEDLHNNPPFQILQTELGPDNSADMKTYKTGGMIVLDFYSTTTYLFLLWCGAMLHITFDKGKDILCYLRL